MILQITTALCNSANKTTNMEATTVQIMTKSFSALQLIWNLFTRNRRHMKVFDEFYWIKYSGWILHKQLELRLCIQFDIMDWSGVRGTGEISFQMEYWKCPTNFHAYTKSAQKQRPFEWSREGVWYIFPTIGCSGGLNNFWFQNMARSRFMYFFAANIIGRFAHHEYWRRCCRF